MIEAVILKVSPEMLKALQQVADSDQQIENWLHVNGESIAQGGPALVSHYGAELMVESWFSGDDLQALLNGNPWTQLTYPEVADDDLVHDFVETVLKIYRLTVSV